jgi:D-xylonolactonase
MLSGKSAAMHPELVVDSQCHTGENPLWHPLEQRLYWTDIPRGQIFRFDPLTGNHELCHAGIPVGGFTVQADGALLLFMAGGAVAKLHGGHLEYIVESPAGEQGSRFNDVIADPMGRVFCGMMPTSKRSGRLYRMDTDGSVHLLMEDAGLPNGMGFTPDSRGMYYTDSLARTIYIFDYDVQKGLLSNRRIWLDLSKGKGAPDGLAVDSQGYVWSARWDGSAVYRYTPEGVEERRVKLQAKKVTSITFGGKDLDDLYITTALTDRSRDEEGAGAGAVFRLLAGIRGVPEFFSRVLIASG